MPRPATITYSDPDTGEELRLRYYRGAKEVEIQMFYNYGQDSFIRAIPIEEFCGRLGITKEDLP